MTDNQTGSAGVTVENGWMPIETAPKDGRVIRVMHEDIGSFPMAWNPTGTNCLFAPDEIGLWEMADRSMTWRDGEDGPTHWKPFTPPEAV